MNRENLRRKWIESFRAWAKAREDIRAAFLVGSMGRAELEPVDEWSDVDLLFITTNLQTFTKDNNWMKEIGPFWTGVLPAGEIFGGLMQVHCGFSAFEEGMVVEYFILSSARIRLFLPLIRLMNRFPSLRRWLPESLAELGMEIGEVLRNGAQIILDKDGLAERLRETTLRIPVVPPSPPSKKEFQNNVDDFWLGPSKLVASLRRGLLMDAMKYLELTRRDLLKMIEWHARAKDGWRSDDLAFRPTRIETWADPRVKEMLPHLYAGYKAVEIWEALFALMELYPWLARESADMLGYPCNFDGAQVIIWTKECFADYSQG